MKLLFVSLHENNEWWDIELVQSIIVGLWKEWLSKYNYTIVTAEGNVMTILIGELYEVVFLAYDLPWLFSFLYNNICCRGKLFGVQTNRPTTTTAIV